MVLYIRWKNYLRALAPERMRSANFDTANPEDVGGTRPIHRQVFGRMGERDISPHGEVVRKQPADEGERWARRGTKTVFARFRCNPRIRRKCGREDGQAGGRGADRNQDQYRIRKRQQSYMPAEGGGQDGEDVHRDGEEERANGHPWQTPTAGEERRPMRLVPVEQLEVAFIRRCKASKRGRGSRDDARRTKESREPSWGRPPQSRRRWRGNAG
jgi:hypothetical protein